MLYKKFHVKEILLAWEYTSFQLIRSRPVIIAYKYTPPNRPLFHFKSNHLHALTSLLQCIDCKFVTFICPLKIFSSSLNLKKKELFYKYCKSIAVSHSLLRGGIRNEKENYCRRSCFWVNSINGDCRCFCKILAKSR